MAGLTPQRPFQLTIATAVPGEPEASMAVRIIDLEKSGFDAQLR